MKLISTLSNRRYVLLDEKRRLDYNHVYYINNFYPIDVPDDVAEKLLQQYEVLRVYTDDDKVMANARLSRETDALYRNFGIVMTSRDELPPDVPKDTIVTIVRENWLAGLHTRGLIKHISERLGIPYQRRRGTMAEYNYLYRTVRELIESGKLVYKPSGYITNEESK